MGVQLPFNELMPLMKAVAVEGPVVVSVSAFRWFHYDRGIYDGCGRNAVIDHAVLMVGYGKSGAHPYWKIRNSWGKEWGEHGYIRLLRHESDSDGYCGIDHNPSVGSGCDDGPKSVPVCGMCGVLSDSSYPTDVK